LFNGNDKLAQAWIEDGGEMGAAYSRLSADAQAQYRLLRNAGQHRRATSFLAAGQVAAENGAGSTDHVRRAINDARKLGATDQQLAGSWMSLRSTYRNAGRGDIAGEMDDIFTTSGNIPPVTGTLGATYATSPYTPTAGSDVNGWNSISASATHREVGNMGSAAQISYRAWLDRNPVNLRTAVSALHNMEGRARTAASTQILNSAIFSGIVPTGSDINDVKTHFGITT
jgi:hypothetical protein